MILPDFDFRPNLQKRQDKLYIYDSIRRQYLLLTPEEYVRQSLLARLATHHQYPTALMSVETGLRYLSRSKRTDVVVYARSGAAFLLLECKAMSTTLDERVLAQAAQYNEVLGADYVAISNGTEWLAWERQAAGNYAAIEGIPQYSNT